MLKSCSCTACSKSSFSFLSLFNSVSSSSNLCNFFSIRQISLCFMLAVLLRFTCTLVVVLKYQRCSLSDTRQRNALGNYSLSDASDGSDGSWSSVGMTAWVLLGSSVAFLPLADDVYSSMRIAARLLKHMCTHGTTGP